MKYLILLTFLLIGCTQSTTTILPFKIGDCIQIGLSDLSVKHVIDVQDNTVETIDLKTGRLQFIIGIYPTTSMQIVNCKIAHEVIEANRGKK